MLATTPDTLPELPLAGSEGFLRGTATPARVIRRHADGTCLVKLFDKHPITGKLVSRLGSSANRTVPESDLYATENEAQHCGRKPRLRVSRRGLS